MIFSEDAFPKQLDTKNPDWDYIETSLKNINQKEKCYFILTDELSYIQCAGKKSSLTVEIREYNDKAFKHFVLGHTKIKDVSTIVWIQIECRVGPINIH